MPEPDPQPPRSRRSAPGLFSNFGGDLSASIVVFLVALPLCMGIAIASGVQVSAGLITGIVGGLIVGWIAGAPLQVSGPAAGLTVIVFDLVRDLGPEALGPCVLIAGLVQVVCGLLGFGVWFRAVSPAVIRGMLTGIGILIFASQCHVMVDDKPRGNALANLRTLPEAVVKGLPTPPLGEEDTRAAEVELLRESGTLHERQAALRIRVGEDVPRGGAELGGAAGPLLEEQRAIRDAFRTLADRNDAAWEGNEARGAERSAAAAAAAATLDEAVDALESLGTDDPEPVRQAVNDAAVALLDFEGTLKNHGWAANVGLLSIAVIVLWNLGTTKVPGWKRLAFLPAPLLAVLAATGLAWWLTLPVLYVEVPANLLAEIYLPTPTLIRSLDWGAVILGGLVIGAVASAESLLCAGAVDKLHSGVRANFDRELAAQGVGNTVCGLLGALPMTGVIVRSSANIRSGAETRLSAILHGAWLLIFVALLGGLLSLIPTACLAGILVYIGWKLVDFHAVRELYKLGKGELFVFLTTVAVIVCVDLLWGVMTGIVLAAVRLLLKFSKLRIDSTTSADGRRVDLSLKGAATFLRLPKLADALEKVPDGAAVHVDLRELSYIDHACLDLLADWRSQHEDAGGEMEIDWDLLNARFGKAATPNETPAESEEERAEEVV